MIYTKFYIKPSAGSIHLTLRGHAGAGPKGSDLICASVTTLAYALAQTIQFYYEQAALKCKPRIWLGDGEATIIATPRDESFSHVMLSFWTIQCGFYVLAKNYPQYISLEPVKYQPEKEKGAE